MIAFYASAESAYRQYSTGRIGLSQNLLLGVPFFPVPLAIQQTVNRTFGRWEGFLSVFAFDVNDGGFSSWSIADLSPKLKGIQS